MYEAASDRCLLHPSLGPLGLCVGCQLQLGWWCPTICQPGRGSAAGTVLRVGIGSAPGSAPVWLCDWAGRHTQNQPKPSTVLRGILPHSEKGWVKTGLEECPCPPGCSGVWWLGDEGERCPWLATPTLHRPWGYFSFWSRWNTKYGDFSSSETDEGLVGGKQPFSTEVPSPRSVRVMLGAGARDTVTQSLKSKWQRHGGLEKVEDLGESTLKLVPRYLATNVDI